MEDGVGMRMPLVHGDQADDNVGTAAMTTFEDCQKVITGAGITHSIPTKGQ